ncbi:VCBS repeat-containing protein [Candidatus Uhrbacteria bacterium]|nr:VCBS repeat-containing protein [Candidatus Uhrbacteria bacterium]
MSKNLFAAFRKMSIFFCVFSLLFSNIAPVLASDADMVSVQPVEDADIPSQTLDESTTVEGPTDPEIAVPSSEVNAIAEFSELEDTNKDDIKDSTDTKEPPEAEAASMRSIDDETESIIDRVLSQNLAKANQQNIQQNTGNLVYRYPISIPPGRSGLQPNYELVYESQASTLGSIYGANWSDNIPYIQRYAKKGVDRLYSTTTPQYFTSYWDGELTTTTNPVLYVARTENGDFRKYEFTSTTNQWLVTDKAGTRYTFGYSTSTRQDDPNDGTRVFKWMLEEMRDTNDNYIKYTYSKDSGVIYPASIIYTGNGVTDGIFQINFVTSTRTDTASSTNTGFNIVPKYLVSRIDVNSDGSLVRQYSLGYTTGDNGTRSLLSTVVESGRDEFSNTVTQPTTTFSYQTQVPGWSSSSTWYPPALLAPDTYQDIGYRVVDVNGDALADVIRGYYDGGSSYSYEAYINNGNGWTADSAWNPPVPFTQINKDLGCRILDVNGDGLTDIICSYWNGSWNSYSAHINNGNGWTADSAWNPPVVFNQVSGHDRGYKIADFNGDGLPDFVRSVAGANIYEAWINNGNGWTSDPSWYPPELLTSDTLRDRGWKVFDANADGLADLIRGYYDGSSYYYSAYINNGHGWTSDPTWKSPVVLSNYVTDDMGYRIMDVNGDSLPDMVRSYSAGGNYYEAWINNGRGWTSDSNWYPPVLLWISSGKDAAFKIADVDGDGMPDMIRSLISSPYVYEAWIDNGKANSLLSRITYPQGGNVSFVYKRAAQFRNENGGIANRAHVSIPTVSNIVVSDGLGNIATTTYAYNGGMYSYNNPFDSRFAGFASTTVVDPHGNVTKTFFHQGNASDSTQGEFTDNYFKIGKPYRIEKYDGSSNLFEKTINKWDSTSSTVASTTSAFVKLAQAVVYTYDGDSSHKDKAEAYTYDNINGNQTQKVEYGHVTGSDDGTFTDSGTDLVTTNISYASGATSSVIGAVKQVTVLDQSSNQMKDEKYYYDGLSFGSVDKGNRTKVEAWKTASTYIDSQAIYNNFGLVATSTDPRGKASTYTYDAFNLYPATTTNPLGQKTQYIYNYSVGEPKQVIDPNGLIAETVYDGLGRVTEVYAPDPVTSSTLNLVQSLSYTDTSGAFSIKNTQHLSSTSTADSYLYLDGLGRLIQSRQPAATSTVLVVKDFFFNSLGLPAGESLPYFSSGTSRTSATTSAAMLSSLTYDTLQRVKTSSNILGNTTTTHSDWKITITDPNGKTKDLVYDAYNRLVEVNEHNATSTYYTYYQYDGVGNLKKITDASGNVRNFTYDGLGRRLTAEDLHSVGDGTFGSWTYTYDDSGNLTSLVDPKSQTVNYTYDDVHRPLTEDYTGQAGTEVAYTYDNCSFGIGSLCTASSTQIRIQNTYNPLHLIASETKTIDGADYVTQYTYDRLGNLLTMTNPDSSQIKYDYTGGRFLNAVSKKETTDVAFVPIVSSFEYAPHEQVSKIVYSNGVTQVNTYDPAKLYRLTGKTSALPNLSYAQNLSYVYDAVGNITQLIESGATSVQRTINYGYDDLYRLTSAVATGTAPGIQGYNQTFSYDALGNILTSDQGSYTYAGTSYANPHAATAIGGLSLTYDNNGNLTGTTGSSTSALAWDYLNRLDQYAASGTTSTYAYDPSGERIKVAISTATSTITTFYPSKFYNISSGTPTKHVFANGIAIATIIGTGASSTVSSILTDHLTGSNIVTDASGTIIEASDYYPYGAIRIDEQAGFNEQRKFAGHEFDQSTGLHYMNARYQNSSSGGFISQDPIIISKPEKLLADPQQQNYYSYARNNPINNIDPTGLLTVVIPGTWYNPSDWSLGGAKGDFLSSVQNTFQDRMVVVNNRSIWSGGDNDASRQTAAEGISEAVNNYQFADGEKLNLVGHSHGGNVANLVTGMVDRQVDNLVTLGTPVISGYSADRSNVKNHVNVYSGRDAVQGHGGNQLNMSAFLGAFFGGQSVGGNIKGWLDGNGLGWGQFGIAGRVVDGATNINSGSRASDPFTEHGSYFDSAVWDQVKKDLK